METFQFHESPIELTLANMSAADILLNCSCVCKRWYNIIGNSLDLWQTLLTRDYKKNEQLNAKKEYINLYKRFIHRENAVENSVKAHPLFDVEMLEASIRRNIGNLNRPRINLEALLLSQHLYSEWSSLRVINLNLDSIVLLSHVLSRFCAEFIYDAGVMATGLDEIPPECVRVVMQTNRFFASSILSAMVGSPIRIHPQNINNILNTMQWETTDNTEVRMKMSRQGLALVISFIGDAAAQLIHSSISIARKKGSEFVDRNMLLCLGTHFHHLL